MPKLRISIVQYLNTAPLVRGFTHGPSQGKYELSFTVPSRCAEALRTREADIAIIPAIEHQRIPGLVVLPGLSIASKQSVRSLLLISKRRIAEVRSIALDRSSRSTQALTRILCARHWQITPEFSESAPDLRAMLQLCDAALLIGDPALHYSLSAESGRQDWRFAQESEDAPLHVYDIVKEWRAMTGLPAVLAVWAARPEIVSPELVCDFQASRDLGVAQIPAIADEAAAELGLPAAALARYLAENINFSLDEENLTGLARYFVEAAKLKLIDASKPITIAARSTSVSHG